MKKLYIIKVIFSYFLFSATASIIASMHKGTHTKHGKCKLLMLFILLLPIFVDIKVIHISLQPICNALCHTFSKKQKLISGVTRAQVLWQTLATARATGHAPQDHKTWKTNPTN